MIELKDSGIDWIGKIPAHWEIKRMKDVSELYTGKSLNDSQKELYGDLSGADVLPYIGSKDVDVTTGNINYESGYAIPITHDGFPIATKGSSLLCIEGGSAGKKIGCVEKDVYFVNKLCCVKSHINQKYIYFFLNSNLFLNQFNKNLQGMIGGVSVALIKTFFVACPPIEEQQLIADYLERKTSEIDGQISLLEDKLDSYTKLKKSLISEVITHGLNPHIDLKDSGKDWIDKIPTHWEIKRMKDVSELYTGKSLNDSQKELYGDLSGADVLPYIGSKDVDATTGSVNYESGYAIPITHYGFPVATKGSSLLCIEGGSAGKKIGQVEKDVYFVNKLCCIKSRLNPKYIYFFLNSNLFSNQFNKNLQGMIGGVSVALIKTFFVTCPPLEEQQAIADYLDQKTAKIDEQIALIDKKIEAYKKLKQSLIDEVVTGKRKIN